MTDSIARQLCTLLEEADDSQRFKDCAAAFLGGHGTTILAALAAPAGCVVARELAADWLARADTYEAEARDPDRGDYMRAYLTTNASSLRYVANELIDALTGQATPEGAS